MLTPQIQLKLKQLFTCDTSSRFDLLFQTELPSDFIYSLDLEGPPTSAARTVYLGLQRYQDKAVEEKFVAHIEALPVPSFIQQHLDKGYR